MSSPTRNPVNRFDPREVVWDEDPPRQDLRIVEDDSQGVLTRNDSPDIDFTWSVNPYRGCTHACAYCYARPYHEYLGFGAGTDFERRIVVKRRAPALLRAAFDRSGWAGEPVAFSGVTDCYQPLERRYRLTRGCLEVCARYRNPVQVITRSPLITRDLDVLQDLQVRAGARVTLSLPVPDEALCRKLEPGAPPPAARLEAITALARAGIPVGVSVSPVIPGLTDSLVPDALKRARDAGATWAFSISLRLPGAVAVVFEERLREALPTRADGVLHRIRQGRRGALNDSRFGSRMAAQGEAADVARKLFDVWHRRLGYGDPPEPVTPSPFQRPGHRVQLPLFGA